MNDVTKLICESIHGGDVDGDLVLIRNAINMRTDFIGGGKKFARGGRVKFNDKVNPKYLKGGRATVRKINDKTVLIDIDHDSRLRRFSGKTMVRAYKTTLDIID